MLNVAHIDHHSFIYGPGERMVIWVQGCNLGCPGCWNTSMHSFDTKKLIETEAMLLLFSEYSSREGITILGGEPLLQKKGLFDFLVKFKEIFPNKSVILYSGFEDGEIVNSDWDVIRKTVDIIISGRYQHKLRDTKLYMRGSSNQKLNFLSQFYNESIIQEGNYVEVEIDQNGQTTTRGYPSQELTKMIK
jgi:anaerobic ribonucleoside-triphosphate reductase activating protein